MPNDVKTLPEELSELMNSQSLSAEKLAGLTDIPTRFISAIQSGDLEKLPAEPYVRGYLIKMSPILKVEPERLIAAYRESAKIRKSGVYDKLPGNRFAKIHLKKGWVTGTLIAFSIILFFIFRFDAIFGIPSLNVDLPEMSRSESIKISGVVRPGDRVMLNGEPLYVDNVGQFEKTVSLLSGLNTFNFKVKRFLGRELDLVRQIYYETATATESSQPAIQ